MARRHLSTKPDPSAFDGALEAIGPDELRELVRDMLLELAAGRRH